MPLPDFAEVIEETNRLDSFEAVGTYFLRLMRRSGFDESAFHILQRVHMPTPSPEIPLVHDFPEEWTKRWFEENLYDRDPTIQQIPHERSLYRWYDIGDRRDLSADEREYLAIAKEAGHSDGLQIPLFGPRGEVASIALGVHQGKIELSPQELLQLHHFGYRIYTRLQILRDGLPQGSELPSLSPREKEILKWVALGKSNSVISDILSISEHTVDSLLRRAFRKLGVSNRIGAVLKAVQWGMIQLA